MKWVSCLVFGLIGFGFGIIFTYWIQGQFVYGPIQNYIIGGASFGLIVSLLTKGVEMVISWRSGNKKEKNKAITNLIKHTEVLIPELKKFSEQPLAPSKDYPSSLAIQHILSGYKQLTNTLEGNKGLKNTESRYSDLETKIKDYITNIVKKQVPEKLSKPRLTVIYELVEDIKYFHERRRSKGKSYIFSVLLDTSLTPNKHVLQSVKDDGTIQTRYIIGDKKDLLALAETMNNLLKDSYIQEMTKTLWTLGNQLHELRITFRRQTDSIIDEITYAITDKDKILHGNCTKCSGIKEKWKINHENKK